MRALELGEDLKIVNASSRIYTALPDTCKGYGELCVSDSHLFPDFMGETRKQVNIVGLVDTSMPRNPKALTCATFYMSILAFLDGPLVLKRGGHNLHGRECVDKRTSTFQSNITTSPQPDFFAKSDRHDIILAQKRLISFSLEAREN